MLSPYISDYPSQDIEYHKMMKLAKSEIKLGYALYISTGFNRDIGRYIDVQTDQGWNPEHFWQEFHDEPYLGSNDSLS